MKAHGANFPTDEEIKEKYYLQRNWDNYKKQLIKEILDEKDRRMREANHWHKLT